MPGVRTTNLDEVKPNTLSLNWSRVSPRPENHRAFVIKDKILSESPGNTGLPLLHGGI